jgi:hypothetical protein
MPLLHKGCARELEEEGPAQGGRSLLVQPCDEPAGERGRPGHISMGVRERDDGGSD